MNDSIIRQLRSIREQHAASFDYDLDRIYADLKERQTQHATEGWVVVSPPSVPLPDVELIVQRTRFAGR